VSVDLESCPSCHGVKVELRESSKRLDGLKRKRWLCLECRERWSVYYRDGVVVPKPASCSIGNSPAKRLTKEEVQGILALGGTLSAAKIGAQFGVSRTSVNLILTGRSNRALSEALGYEFHSARSLGERRSCGLCVHSRVTGVDAWVCGLGFPDVEAHGAWFARDCSCFARGPVQFFEGDEPTP
jgi:hypothetical protein